MKKILSLGEGSYTGNSFINWILENDEYKIDYIYGIYYTQNREYICTKNMVKNIVNYKNHGLLFVSGFSWFIRLLIKKNQ